MTTALDAIRARDAAKGYSEAGITMTQSEADRRVLLAALDRADSDLTQAAESLRVAGQDITGLVVENDRLRTALDRAEAALRRIRDMDYRGNPSPESGIAREALRDD